MAEGVQRRPGEPLHKWRQRQREAAAGAAAAPEGDRGYTAAELDKERQRFRRSSGVGGLGGAAKATKPEFQAREKKHLDAWKKARREAAAKKRAQQSAAKKLAPASE
jgi:hypothetical protein